ncbi:MAG: DUF4197 domain-containing protein [Lewinellaceae bacterium]|nr:DUF4197 domain-containing protein [Lewinellaceae bacterium]
MALTITAASYLPAQINLKKAQDAVGGIKIGDKGIGLSQDEIGRGLKEALDNGVGEAVTFLSAKDGYYKSAYKILMPEEAQKVADKLKAVPGFGNVEADLTERMNRAAEDAAVKAKPIFIAAITKMTFQDAMNILMGDPNSATLYLNKSTYQPLYAEFKPIIQESLDKVNARTYWRDAVTAYNKIPFVTKTNPELDDHVTKMALSGMFSLIEKKEAGIRSDVNQRSSPLLQKVFSKQDKK